MRYFLAALSALVLVLPAGSTSLADKHYFTVVDNTEASPDCPPDGLQVKCSTESTWGVSALDLPSVRRWGHS